MKLVEYAVYRGDDLLVMGTIDECAKYLKVKPNTVRFYSMPVYAKRAEQFKKPSGRLIAIKLEGDE